MFQEHRATILLCSVLLLLQTSMAQAQMTTGGDFAGGYLRTDSKTYAEWLKHGEGKASLWFGYKAKHYDWRLLVAGNYKDVDGENVTYDIFSAVVDSASLTTTEYMTNEKPFNLTARYDFNWRQADKSTYSLWTQYDYDHLDYESSCMGVKNPVYSDGNVFGRFEIKEDEGHKVAVGYRGSTVMGDRRPAGNGKWVLKSNADVSLSRKEVCDAWLKLLLDAIEDDALSTWDTQGWEMHPDYTDYVFNAALHLTDTIRRQGSSRLVLGGGVRFNGEGERFTHDSEVSVYSDFIIKVDTLFIDQHATGFRFFVEPFLSGEWQKDRWALSAEYGLRLYHTNTTDDTGNAVRLYNYMDPENTLSGHRFSHFTPLVVGRSQLTYNLSKQHRLTLANNISNRLPSNQYAVLRFLQLRDYNKVSLGNPHLKPEVRIRFSLGHTFTCGPFSAKTDVSVERDNNEMEPYFYGCSLGGRNEVAQIMRNVGDATSYRLSETLAWNSKWLKTHATLWFNRAHFQGRGKDFSENVVNDNSWGWEWDAKVDFGCGWVLTTDFRYRSRFKTMTSDVDRMWQTATVSIEKRFGYVTLYLKGNSLINPASPSSRYDMKGNMVYDSESRKSNRIVLLGCRWSL